MEVVIRNTRGVEGCDFGYSINDSEMIINDGTIRAISKTDGFGVLTSKHIRVDNNWVEIEEIRHYARLIRKVKYMLLEKTEHTQDEDELLSVLKSI